MDCVRTSIIGRPRRLSAQRRAVSWNHRSTLSFTKSHLTVLALNQRRLPSQYWACTTGHSSRCDRWHAIGAFARTTLGERKTIASHMAQFILCSGGLVLSRPASVYHYTVFLPRFYLCVWF